MKRKSIGTNYSMCVQPTFIIGTYNEDNSPNFAPITWVSATCEGEDYLLVISMFGTKKTKQNVLRTNALSANLASTDMLNLVDYFGCSQKGMSKVTYSYEKSKFVFAPILDASRWVYECEVVTSIKTGASDTFFCKIKNIQIDESIEVGDTFWDIDLTKFDPVIYSGHYHSLGKHLGKIGDFLENKPELWDAYYADGTLAGCDLIRGEKIPNGLRHMVAEVFVMHADGSILLMQRDFGKPNYPGFWESGASGSVLKGESAIDGAKRELLEETGITADNALESLYYIVSSTTIYRGYLYVADIPKNNVTLQKGETIAYRWVSRQEFRDIFYSDQYVDGLRERLSEFVEHNFQKAYD